MRHSTVVLKSPRTRRDDHVLPALIAIFTMGKNVAEVRISKLVETIHRTDRKLTPDIRTTTEVQLLK